MRFPKSALLLSFFCFVLCPTLVAGDYTGSIRFEISDLNIYKANGYDYVSLMDGVSADPPGAPALPSVQMDVAIPWNTEALGVSLQGVDLFEIPGGYDVVPMTTPKPVSRPGPEGNPFIKDPRIYGQDAYYPGFHVEILSTWDLAGQKFVKLAFHPLRYNPKLGKLDHAVRIDFRIALVESSNPPVQPTFNYTASGRAYYERFLKSKAMNPEDVSVPLFIGSSSRSLPPGQYEHVIITPETFENDWNDLVEWHTRKGYPDMVVTKEFIYANYSGSDNQEKIRNFVIDAETTWGTRFFLIGADGGGGSNEIPYHEINLLSEWVPNDTYYADYNDNYVVDVHVGRATITNTTQIGNFIDKVLHYEKTPTLVDYGKTVFHMGFDLDSSSPGEDTKEYIKNNYLPGHVTFITEYDSESGSHLGDVIAYMNDGPNLVNHIDHCNWSVWGMGYVNHGGLMDASHVSSLSNGMDLINFYTLGCHASAWDHGESLSETFMRLPGNGGVSFTGNTRYGWYSPGYYDKYSSLYDIRWWHVLFTDNQYHVGETLSAHKNDYYPPNEHYKYIFMELNLLGDPSMPLWTDDPDTMAVTHDDPIFTGPQTYLVNVQEGGTDLEDALVCLWKDSEVYVFDRTDASGDASFTIDPATTGTMYVTVTAKDCLPHEGQVAVNPGDPPVLTDITPTDGGSAGGTSCTITGINFTTAPDTTVTFGGVAAANVAVVDPNTITCDSPGHSAGSVDVTVSNSNGSDTLPGAFTYHNPPSISAVSPDNGTPLGGTNVTISGNDFTALGATDLTFGGTPASSIVVVDSLTITCTTPAHGAGSVNVVVTNDFGSDTLNDGYTYNNPPTLSGIDPEHGLTAGGTAVTITGSDFTSTGDTTVTMGGGAVTNLVVVDATTMTCDTPAHGAGSVDVDVSNSNGSDTLPGAFTYHDAPGISAISPDNGTPLGGTNVTISGSDFTSSGTTVVTFDTVPATGLAVVDASTITCTTPAHGSGSVDVTVTNEYGSDTLNNGYTYNNPPALSGISPEHGTIAGGTGVTITGNDFTSTGDTTVTFGGVAASNLSVVNAGTITCDTPANGAGPVDLEVSNSNGTDTLPGAFTYHNPPSISAVAPDNGTPLGGTNVTISGNDFTALGATDLTFGGTPASSIVVVDSLTITCTTPAHGAGSVNVVVTNDFGSDTLNDGYTYNNPPTLSGISPEDGTIAGGTAVTITGSDFTSTGDTTVTIGGGAVTNLVVVDATTMTCDTPAHGVGSVDVNVSNSNGSDTLPGAFTYHDAPGISAISPDSGTPLGGTNVTISGNDFTSTGTTTVTFDATPATSVVVVDASTITCTTPAHGSGSVDVTVTNEYGSDTLTGGYTYNNPPVLSGINPEHGPIAGGTAVTITGNDFTSTGDTTVTVGGAAVTNLVVVDATTMTCNTPAHGAGSVDVAVSNSNGSDTLPGAFTYHNPPLLSGIVPDMGPAAGGTPVTITGNYFTYTGDTGVTFDGLPALNMVVVDANTITCETPAHGEGAVDVNVSNSYGSNTLQDGFTYYLPPVISSVDPLHGPVAGGTPVTIYGNNFYPELGFTVDFDASPATNVTVIDSTTINCTSPAHAAGLASVTVNHDFGSNTLVDCFTYHNPPVIALITPDNGAMTGGTAVTITGSDFTTTGDTTVTIGGAAAMNWAVIDSTTITCETPASATSGAADVEVINSWGSDLLAGGFTYNPPPGITGITPSSGLTIGGTSVTITGKDFLPAEYTKVIFGGSEALNVVVIDASTITCNTPAYPVPDIIDVEVVNSNGSDTLVKGFEFIPQSGNPPQNLTDVDTSNLHEADKIRLAITGQPGALYMMILSFGGGPLNTPWGQAGLSFPIYPLWSLNLNASGYHTMTMEIPSGLAGLTFYMHALVDDSPPVWATGGNNPNGTGSIELTVN